MSGNRNGSVISRRAVFSLFGLAAASSLALPATLLAMTEADAQTGGMERRDDRRENRGERRDDRRKGRDERRTERRSKKKQKKKKKKKAE
jgi:hypothetical protein